MQSHETPQVSLQRLSLRSAVLLALWFGLASGWLEAVASWIYGMTGIAGWKAHPCLSDLNVIWATTLVNTILFVAVGVALFLVSRLKRDWNWPVILTAVFSAFTFYVLLELTGRLRERGSIMLALGLGVVMGRWARKRGGPDPVGFFRRTVLAWASCSALSMLIIFGGPRVVEKYQTSRLPRPPANAPNVLLIVLDTLRADRVSAYGYPRKTSPFLDELAGKGVVFEQAFANSSWTLPSHVTLFTGRLPGEHGAAIHAYDGRFPTVAESFKKRGYLTAGFSANSGYTQCAQGVSRGFGHFESQYLIPWPVFRKVTLFRRIQKFLRGKVELLPERPFPYAADIHHRLTRWLDHKPERPLFVFLNMMEMHTPQCSPEEYAQEFGADRVFTDAEWNRLKMSSHPPVGEWQRRVDGTYDGALRHLDDQLRQLFEDLHRRKLDQNLLIIITSDHGESLGEHNLYAHRHSLYIEQLRVPLIVHFPGKIPAGLRVRTPVGLDQVAGTILELTGSNVTPFPAATLKTVWEQNTKDAAVIAELSGGAFPGVERHWPIHQGWLKSVVTSRWHFILKQNGEKELYDWPADPSETHNLAASTAFRDVVATLEAQLDAAAQSAGSHAR